MSYSYDARRQQDRDDRRHRHLQLHLRPVRRAHLGDERRRPDDGYGYNPDGEATGITYPLPSTATWATTDTVSYSYDHAGELTGVTDFNGNQVAITSTADGSPTRYRSGQPATPSPRPTSAADNPSAITLKNSGTTLQSFSYSDSPAGTILTETDTPSSALARPADYTYDAKGRVTSMTPGSGSADDYSFDASGNLTTLPAGATGSYDDAGELTSRHLSAAPPSYTYNADGERLSAAQGHHRAARPPGTAPRS